MIINESQSIIVLKSTFSAFVKLLWGSGSIILIFRIEGLIFKTDRYTLNIQNTRIFVIEFEDLKES